MSVVSSMKELTRVQERCLLLGESIEVICTQIPCTAQSFSGMFRDEHVEFYNMLCVRNILSVLPDQVHPRGHAQIVLAWMLRWPSLLCLIRLHGSQNRSTVACQGPIRQRSWLSFVVMGSCIKSAADTTKLSKRSQSSLPVP